MCERLGKALRRDEKGKVDLNSVTLKGLERLERLAYDDLKNDFFSDLQSLCFRFRRKVTMITQQASAWDTLPPIPGYPTRSVVRELDDFGLPLIHLPRLRLGQRLLRDRSPCIFDRWWRTSRRGFGGR